VRVSQFKGSHYNKINYEFITLDGKKLDLTTDNYNIRYIDEVENQINDTIPHFITKDLYYYLTKNYPHFITKDDRNRLKKIINTHAHWKVTDQ
jgi:hypothetical protein